METIAPKHQQQARQNRRSDSRHRRRQKQTDEQQQQQQLHEPHQLEEEKALDTNDDEQDQLERDIEQDIGYPSSLSSCIDANSTSNMSQDDIVTEQVVTSGVSLLGATTLGRMSRTTSAGTTASSTLSHSSSQHTVLLVNGESPPNEQSEIVEPITILIIENDAANKSGGSIGTEENALNQPSTTLSPKDGGGSSSNRTRRNGGSGESSRNSSGDAQSLRETLQQLRPPAANGSSGHYHRHHHHRTRSPQSPPSRRDRHRDGSRVGSTSCPADISAEKSNIGAAQRAGIMGFMERELRQGSLGNSSTRKVPSSPLLSDDPQASPAQRSIRSRSSLEKSPRRKRSKSESRRRRERKLIAAGEMEVRQANETLMRYLKQCSEMNDASLSGELEIDQNYDERRVHRKTKSQRDKRGHLISKLYTAGGGISSLLRELSDDIVPAEGEEIYNPFTPVVSPTEENGPTHIDKMFLQTSSGYRPVERCYFQHHHHHHHHNGSGSGSNLGGNVAGCSFGGSIHNGISRSSNAQYLNGAAASSGVGSTNSAGVMIGSYSGGDFHGSTAAMRFGDSYGDDIHCLLDAEKCSRHTISTNIELACFMQRIWLLVSNICHGLLAGLALAHLLFVLSSPHPTDWTKAILNLNSDSNIKNNVKMNINTNYHNYNYSDQLDLTGETLTMTTAQPKAGSAMQTAASETTNTASVVAAATIPTLLDAIGNSAVYSTGQGNFPLSETEENLSPTNEVMTDYVTFANIYLNLFYCLAIVCLVSVLDRMDICRWDLSNATELISFRWLIIAMIYIATIILTICSDSIDEKLFFNRNLNVTLTQKELLSNSIRNIWSSLSLTRSIAAVCGWIMIGLTPNNDLLYEHLVDLTRYQIINN